MRVYVAGSYADRFRIAVECGKLKSRGYEVVGKWWDNDYFIERYSHVNYGTPGQSMNIDTFMKSDVAEAMGMIDTYHVMDAGVVLVDTLGQTSTGGREVEFGMALLRQFRDGIRLIRIGPPRNVFHQLVRECYENWEQFWEKA